MKKALLSALALVLLSGTSRAIASPRAENQKPSATIIAAADEALNQDRSDSARGTTSVADTNQKKMSAPKVSANQEIGDGQCFEYVIFEIWHVWIGCDSKSGGGGGGGW